MTASGRKFAPDILKDFNIEVMNQGVRDLRICVVISSIAFLLFNILDRFIYPEMTWLFLKIRLIVLAGNTVILLLTFLKNAYRFSSFLKVIEYLINSASVIIMVHLTGGYLSPYYAGLNIILIGFMFLLPLNWIHTSIVCILIYIGYLFPILLLQDIDQVGIFLNNNFFLVTTMALAITSSFLSSRMHLKEFASRYNLSRANDEFKNLDKLKTQFFANVSHEVRTPLTSIIAPLQSLRQGDVGSLKIDQNDLLDQMHRNAIRLLDLINQMLDFSKLEAGKAHLRLSLVDMAMYTEDIVSLFREVAIRKDLNLIFEPSEGTDDPIFIDSDRYERIITNLIRNAIKFTESGGITIGLKRESGSIIITITDTGIGISQNNLPHIFRRFEQVDGTTTRSFDGTGLGLAIVEESVQLLHGKIKVESVVDMGTVFTIDIPDDLIEREPHAFVERRNMDRRNLPKSWNGDNRRSDERRKTDYTHIPVSELAQVESQTYTVHSQSTIPETTEPSGIRVLITEDTDDLRYYIAKILTNLGHDVITAENGKVAWELLTGQGGIDILVSDIMMPKMDGYELLQNIRNDTGLQDLPVILITAKAGDDPKLKALGIGADDYLPKPINVRELDARIHNLITSRELRRAAANAAVLDQRIEELMMSFSQTLEIRDAETGNHSREVLEIGTLIARELRLEVDRILTASLLLHDIGKVGIPDSILLKDSRLTDDEMAIMQEHPAIGKELLEDFPNFRDVSDIILAHQEHWDGNGYPNGLKGEEIPRIARIIAVADAYHAMTNTRRYRKALTMEQAIEELKENKGTQFEPEVVDAFVDAFTGARVLS